MYLRADYSLVVPNWHIQATEQTVDFSSLELHLQISEVLLSFQNCSRDEGNYIREGQMFFLPLSGARHFKLEMNQFLNRID